MGGVGRRPGACMLGVLVLSVMIVATPAGRRPFWSSDEARFALLAQDALDHGRWLVAELRGQHYLNKPQLFFWAVAAARSEEHTSELQSRLHLVCRLLLEKKKNPRHSHGGAAVAFGLNGNGSGIAMESCALLGRR